MGKKGSWFSAIKRVFTHDSKDKPPSYGSDKRSSKERKSGKGVSHHGENKLLISRFREPSSIEKILGEADQLLVRPPASSSEAKIQPAPLWRPASPHRAISSPNAASQRVSSAWFTSPKAPSPRAALPPAITPEASQSRWEVRYVQRPEMSLRNQHRSATMIQAAFRSYLARRSFRALRGLVRLQAVVRSTNAQRQTMNAMKQMQLLVRFQTQVQSRRIQMLENQAILNQVNRNSKEESSLSKWSLNQLPEAGYNEDWDDSLLTKEEIEARLRNKVEAVVKRERAMAYAYSHQLWKGSPRTTQTLPDIRSNGLPRWWNWLERQLPPPTSFDPSIQSAAKTVASTPPQPHANNRILNMATESSREAVMPLSSTIPIRAKQFQTMAKTPPPRARRKSNAMSAYDDEESLMSCPPSTTPNYMTPTTSAKAKARASSNPKERVNGTTPANESKRRFSFSLASNFKWNKGSAKEPANQRALEQHVSQFGGDLSVDSTVSMPAVVGRRRFNRFV